MNAAVDTNGARSARGSTSPARTLPHNDDLEQSIIGGVLQEPATLAMLDRLESPDFYNHRHNAIWSAMRNLDAAGTPIDVLTVELELERMGKIDAVGGVAYLGICASRVPIVSNVIEYAKQVKAMSTMRRLMLLTSRTTERGYTYTDDVRELIGELKRELEDLDGDHKLATDEIPFISPGRALEHLDRLASNPVFETQYVELNKALGFGGMLGTQYYTVTAHTGIGKTSFVAQIANHVGRDNDVLIASWEMVSGYFVARMAAPGLRRHSNAIIRGEIPGGQVIAQIAPGVVFLEEPSLDLLRRAAMHLAAKRGRPPLIIVDYLQLMAAQIARTMERPDPKIAVELASAELRLLAKELGAAVLAVSATSRTTGKELAQDVRKRSPRELVGAGRDSGSIEFDGAGVIVLSLTDEIDLDGTVATVTVAKARFGQVCHLDYRWLGEYGQWLENGVVERAPAKAPAASAEPPTSKMQSLRSAITFVLSKAGTIPSKTKIAELTGKTKAHVLKEVDAMVDAGLVRLTAFGYAMADSPSQVELHEAVREVES